MEDLPLLELFTRLCDAGLPLGVRDYEAVLEALRGGFGLPDRSALARLCRTLWVRSPDERQLFDYYFERVLGCQNATITDESEIKIILQKLDLSNSQKNIQQREASLKLIYRVIRTIAYAALLIALVFSLGSGLLLNPALNRRLAERTKTQPNQPLASPSPTTALKIPPIPTQISPIDTGSYSRIWFYWSLGLIAGSLTVCCGLSDRALLQYSRRHHRDVNGLPTDVRSPTVDMIAPNILREINDEVQVAQIVRQATSKESNQVKDRFVFMAGYTPVTRRQMKQSWRHLRRMVRDGSTTELDVDGTVERIARDGILLEPVLVARRTNRTELVLLIDQDGSMVSFHSLSARLAETALRGGRLGKAGIYYFHNCPIGYLYHDPMHYEAEPIEAVFAGLRRDRTVVLIFSDAGAARGGLNLERAKLTATFLQQLNQHVQHVAWLNPVPKPRWATSTAREIARHVPMFEATRPGLDGAIDALRGRHPVLEEWVGGKP